MGLAVKQLKNRSIFLVLGAFFVSWVVPVWSCLAQPIYHETHYPDGYGPFPAVIALHTSGGFKTVKHLIQRYVDDGFVVYAPDFFTRHGLGPNNRMETFSTYRQAIETELDEIVERVKADPKVQKQNVFAVGFSNGGFWATYLAGRKRVRAAASHYGVWKAKKGKLDWDKQPYPKAYISGSSHPILALHGRDDDTQKLKFAEDSWRKIKRVNKRFETHIYDGAGHAWDRQGHRKYVYNAVVDKDSHKRTIEFFRRFIDKPAPTGNWN